MIITLLHGWPIVLTYWILPLFTMMQMIIRLGGICEHQYIYHGSVEETTPLIVLGWWERLLMPNLNFTLHIYHHYFANIPFFNLPKAHALFVKAGLVNDSAVFYGIPSYLRAITKG